MRRSHWLRISRDAPTPRFGLRLKRYVLLGRVRDGLWRDDALGRIHNHRADSLPANAIIDAVVYRVTTTITTATSFTIGDGETATRYCGTKTGLAAGTTGTCTAQGYYLNPTAAGVLITPNATPGAGAMRLLVYYHTWTAPTS